MELRRHWGGHVGMGLVLLNLDARGMSFSTDICLREFAILLKQHQLPVTWLLSENALIQGAEYLLSTLDEQELALGWNHLQPSGSVGQLVKWLKTGLVRTLVAAGPLPSEDLRKLGNVGLRSIITGPTAKGYMGLRFIGYGVWEVPITFTQLGAACYARSARKMLQSAAAGSGYGCFSINAAHLINKGAKNDLGMQIAAIARLRDRGMVTCATAAGRADVLSVGSNRNGRVAA